MKPGANKGPPDDIPDGDRTGKSLPRRLDTKKYSARRTARAMTQIPGQGLTDVPGHREPVVPETRASYRDLPILPVYVIERHVNHFRGTKAESCQKEQDRIVAPACRSRSIATSEETFYVLQLKKLWKIR
jgi:hypothetical protein